MSEYSTKVPGEISPGSLYTIREVRERLKLGTWAWRKLTRAGLPVIRICGRAFVLADDLIAFFDQQK